MAGETRPSPALSTRGDLANLVLFLGDDLRESALAVSAIEAFLVKAQRTLEKPEVTAEELRELVVDEGVIDRIDLLWDALSSLRKSLGVIETSLK